MQPYLPVINLCVMVKSFHWHLVDQDHFIMLMVIRDVLVMVYSMSLELEMLHLSTRPLIQKEEMFTVV